MAFFELQKDDIHSNWNIWKRFFSLQYSQSLWYATICLVVYFFCQTVFRWITEPKSHLSVFSFTGCVWLYRFDSNQTPNCVYYCMFFLLLLNYGINLWAQSFFAVSELFFLLAFHPTQWTRLFSIYFVFFFFLSFVQFSVITFSALTFTHSLSLRLSFGNILFALNWRYMYGRASQWAASNWLKFEHEREKKKQQNQLRFGFVSAFVNDAVRMSDFFFRLYQHLNLSV